MPFLFFREWQKNRFASRDRIAPPSPTYKIRATKYENNKQKRYLDKNMKYTDELVFSSVESILNAFLAITMG